jgi:hypothetical protein
MPLRTCPPPQQDCPLYARRLLEAQQEARLSAAVRREQPEVPSLADLVRQEGGRSSSPPLALPPAPVPIPEPVFETIKRGDTHHE